MVAPIVFPTRPEIAIDFGTANLRIARRGEGVVFDEPSVCCFKRGPGAPSLFAAGLQALPMVGRTPPHLQIRLPLVRGVLQDISAAGSLLGYAVSKGLGRRPLRAPGAIIGVPVDATQAEREALLTAARDAGLGKVELAPEPLAAAVGAGLPVDAPGGVMVVECGAGVTEVAVMSLGGIAQARSVRVGGATLDQAIADFVHARHKILIGEIGAESLKRSYAARPVGDCGSVRIKGRSLTTGMPATLEIGFAELDEVVRKHAEPIAEAVLAVLGETQPGLIEDIHDRGIVLTGGGASIPLIRRLIAEATGVQVVLADEPARCVAKGLHEMLRH